MQRSANVTYVDTRGNRLRLVADEQMCTVAINDTEVFTVGTDETTHPDHVVRALAADLETWANHQRQRRLRQDQLR